MKVIRDTDGKEVTEGCTVRFGYGIPPIGVDAVVVTRNGKLIALTPGHKPPECDVAHIAEHFDFWVVPARPDGDQMRASQEAKP